LPTFSVVAAGEASTPLVYGDPLRLDPASVLHRAQSVEVHGTVPARATGVRHAACVESVWDHGDAAIVVIRVDTSDSAGRPMCTNRFSLHVPGGGGFGGDREPRVGSEDRSRPPDVVIDAPTIRQQALLYRACADPHRIHLDPAVARASGFERPILQGLCTWGVACKHLVDELLDGDATPVRGFAARFAGPVYPGETIRVTAWRDDEGCRFVADVVERSAPALREGRLTLRQPAQGR
jgi:acyl dehydratase